MLRFSSGRSSNGWKGSLANLSSSVDASGRLLKSTLEKRGGGSSSGAVLPASSSEATSRSCSERSGLRDVR